MAMDPDANKRLVERFYQEVWARGNVDFAAKVFADDYIRHDLRSSQATPGPAGQERSRRRFGPRSPTYGGGSIFFWLTEISSLHAGQRPGRIAGSGLERRQQDAVPSSRE
jgi:hypothetical protein